MVFIDIHCHLDFYKDEELELIVRRARKADVKIIVCNGVKPEANRKVLELAEKYSEVEAALGLYPTDALKMSDKEIDAELNFIRKNKDKIIAIGEVGLDFMETGSKERQLVVFEKMIDLSLELDKPLLVHSRKAEKEAIEILERTGAKKVVMHCFSGRKSLVKRIIENDWFLSIPASVKYNQMFQDNVKIIPISQLLCETDSPFLHPDRERHNEPANVIASYKKIAEINGMELKEVEKKIEGNFRKLFVS